jgi:AcrR family transcriptional regulator/DNA-binding MarR family transcriptional regulator
MADSSAWLISRDGQKRVAKAHLELLLDAAARAIAVVGYERTTVKEILAWAGVSKSTFYGLFADRDECFGALVDDVENRVVAELERVEPSGLGWEDQVTCALERLLRLLDEDLPRTRAWAIASMRFGGPSSGSRSHPAAMLAELIEGGSAAAPRARDLTASTARSLAAVALEQIRSRAAHGEYPLSEMLSQLVWLIVLPYRGTQAADLARDRAGATSKRGFVRTAPRVPYGRLELPRFRLTYRTARALEAIATAPGSSNRAVADRAGISDAGQISRLLARLESLGLITSGTGEDLKWASKTWQLTPRGAVFIDRVLPVGPASSANGDRRGQSGRAL